MNAPSESDTRPPAFADRLVAAEATYGPLCVGIDPHAGKLPSIFGPEGPDAASAWGRAVVARAAGKVAMVKPQAGLFERWGSAGVKALEDVCQAARAAGLLVMLDAKRGDIGSTAVGYAEAYLGEGAAATCDAITVNPYMGCDTLEPFLDVARRTGKGVAVLARTSNPGSADFQGRLIEGEPLYIHVARALAGLSSRLQGDDTHWSGLMLVVGATAGDEARAVRAVAPDCPFLVPGYGAQGAGARDAAAGFVREDGRLVGGMINASRSATMPEAASRAETAAAWDAAIDEALDAARRELNAAVSGG